VPLKAYFCLPYFIIVLGQLKNKIRSEEERLERSLFTGDNRKVISPIRDSPHSETQLLEEIGISNIKITKKLHTKKKKTTVRKKRSVTPTRVESASYQRETISTSIKKSSSMPRRFDSRSSSV